MTAGTDYYYVATAVAGGHESAASNEQHVATPTGTPTVVSTTPTDGATAVAVSAPITAQFSVRIDPTTLTSSSFTLQSATGATVAATITYDGTTQTAKLTPTTGLANSTSYLATVATSVRSISGEPLAAPVNWSFVTVAPSPPPTVASTTPASGATGVARDAVITATFSRSMDPVTITASSFRVTENGTPVAGTVAYDAASLTATFLPTATLDAGSTYAGSLAASITAADGTPLGTPVTWSFSTSQSLCPCSLMGNGATPAQTNVSTRDGRPLPGPWSYEQGVKITVDVPMTLTDIRFFKGSQETGTHVGRVWTATGTQLASATFTNGTASGWQRQALSTPLTLQPDTVYIVSVNLNNVFSVTQSGLAAAIDNGPLHSVADGADGVYGSSAGVFPSQSYKNSNYFVDVVVRSDTLSPPTVTAETPGPDSTGVAANTEGERNVLPQDACQQHHRLIVYADGARRLGRHGHGGV